MQRIGDGQVVARQATVTPQVRVVCKLKMVLHVGPARRGPTQQGKVATLALPLDGTRMFYWPCRAMPRTDARGIDVRYADAFQ